MALEADILDMLLGIYVMHLTLFGATLQEVNHKEVLRAAYGRALTVLSQSLQYQEQVLNHPVCILWTDCHSQPPGYTVDASVQDQNTA